MVNKTLLPPAAAPAKCLNPYRIDIFPTGTAFAVLSVNRGLGEPSGSHHPHPAWEGSARII
jgi:hypothetical protein